jgi:poly-gamma-glutamate capsule biosynthesis protein CapA/YwtB (metallophosphatase superfamily)
VKPSYTIAVGLALVLTACSVSGDSAPPVHAAADVPIPAAAGDESTAVRLLFVGDLMLGRRVAPVAESDPEGMFADVERVIRNADLAFANLESPLTTRPHTSENPYALEAAPESAALIAAAGFNVLGIANNHAGDAGPDSVLDTIEAVTDAGMATVGGGNDVDAAWEPLVIDVSGLRIAILAFDISRQGVAAGTGPGVASWDPVRAETAVKEARARADVVVAGIHGGVEYLPEIDPQLSPVADELVSWGVDVVWGHGPHVSQPLSISNTSDGRPAVIATSLGNFLFDQQTDETSRGSILEVLVDDDGVAAWRIGHKQHVDLRVHFIGWDLPVGDAALVDGDWWNLTRDHPLITIGESVEGFPFGDPVVASTGDLTGDGADDLLVSYRHPLRDVAWDPRPLATDASGRSAHLGVFAVDWTPIWMSRRPPHPIGTLAACDGSAAFGYTTLNDPAVVATGAGSWNGFGFTLAPELPDPGTPSCADVDHDGRRDAVIVDRPPPP